MVSFSMVGTNVSEKIDDSIFRLHVTLNRILSTALLYSHRLSFFENKSALYKNALPLFLIRATCHPPPLHPPICS